MLNQIGSTPPPVPDHPVLFLQLRNVLLYLVLPVGIWGGLFLLRPYLYSRYCAVTPTPCLVQTMNHIDQITFRLGNITADFWSNVLQNTVGTIALLMPWILTRKRIQALNSFFFILSTTLINAALLEVTRAWIQRPRPLVYVNPSVEGLNADQYTSFYSGHTSFVALATTALYFLAPQRFKRAALFFSVGATVTTGILRVWGGRHFPSDVIAGGVVGATLAGLAWRRFKVYSI